MARKRTRQRKRKQIWARKQTPPWTRPRDAARTRTWIWNSRWARTRTRPRKRSPADTDTARPGPRTRPRNETRIYFTLAYHIPVDYNIVEAPHVTFGVNSVWNDNNVMWCRTEIYTGRAARRAEPGWARPHMRAPNSYKISSPHYLCDKSVCFLILSNTYLSLYIQIYTTRNERTHQATFSWTSSHSNV